MKPSRKLDALVAEKVMGYQGYPDPKPPHMIRRYSRDDRIPLPGFSTNIAAAWEVVEKMKSPFIALEYRGGVCNYELWDCQIGGLSRSADTMPMAICLAALEYVGRRIEDETK